MVLVTGDDVGLVAEAVRTAVTEALGDEDRSLALEELTEEDYRTEDGFEVARLVDAAEAQSMNLVSRVMPPETLRESTIQYAQELANQVSPRSLRMMKRELYQAQFQSLSEAIDQANQDMLESFSCNDFREGVAHFIEKRPPRFTGT